MERGEPLSSGLLNEGTTLSSTLFSRQAVTQTQWTILEHQVRSTVLHQLPSPVRWSASSPAAGIVGLNLLFKDPCPTLG